MGSDTIADGLAGNAARSTLPFQISQRDVSRTMLVREDAILAGLRHGMVHERLVLEGAGAAALGVVLEGQSLPGEGPVRVILNGANSTEGVMRRALSVE